VEGVMRPTCYCIAFPQRLRYECIRARSVVRTCEYKTSGLAASMMDVYNPALARSGCVCLVFVQFGERERLVLFYFCTAER
jgi:hypothetical protein